MCVYVCRGVCACMFFCILAGNTVYTVRNNVPDPSVSYVELGLERKSCSSTVKGTTKSHVFDDVSNTCREYEYEYEYEYLY